LPVEGSVLISSLIHKFKPEFDAQLSNPAHNPEVFPVPLLADFDEGKRQFAYDEKFAFKNPDWAYSVPVVEEAAPPPWERVDLHHEIDELKASEFWKSERRTAKTLLKRGDLRIVLTLMKAGTVLKEHRTEGNVAIHVLRGSIRIVADGNTGEVEPGQMMFLSPGAPHSVEALDETAFVMLISPSPARQ
jgi:quercetin dioxygenase-like cupin family protein